MNVLALETSTSLGSVALLTDKHCAYRESHRQRSHTEFINLALDQCLSECGLQLQDIDLIATSRGPGSFTGLRVAGNVAKTLAYSLKTKIYVIDSLALLAAQSQFPKLSVAILNAYKNMLFVAAYSQTKVLQEPSAMGLGEFEEFVKSLSENHPNQSVSCLGEGFTEYESQLSQNTKAILQRQTGENDFPNAKALALLASQSHLLGQTIEWNSFVPLYIRASSAEENKRTH